MSRITRRTIATMTPVLLALALATVYVLLTFQKYIATLP